MQWRKKKITVCDIKNLQPLEKSICKTNRTYGQIWYKENFSQIWCLWYKIVAYEGELATLINK